MAYISKVGVYLLKKKKEREKCTYVFTAIQLWLLLAIVLLVGSSEILECSKLCTDSLKFPEIF